MKKTIGFVVAASILLAACASGSSGSGGSSRLGGSDAESAVQSAPAAPVYYSGDGGKGISIAVLVPTGNGIAADQNYLPTMTQGVFVGDFSKYSAVSVLDRQNLDKIIAENYSGYYEEDHPDLNKLGHLLPTDYIMTGTITKTGSGYALQMQIADNKTNVTKASYSGTCSIAEFDNFSGIKKASAELLAQMGVALTPEAKTELAGAAAAQQVNAQTALAKGINAQKKGTEVAALSYYLQSNSYDPAIAEAASRLNVLEANITSGDMGANIRNDIQWRDQWVARLKECEELVAKSVYGPYPYYLVYSTDIKQGAIDYEKRTVDLGISIGMRPNDESWYKALAQVVQTVYNGLRATGRADAWKLGGWPEVAVSLPGLFSGDGYDINHGISRYYMGYTVLVEIANANGKTIARNTVSIPGGFLFSGGQVVPVFASMAIPFRKVNPEDITPRMSIKIAAINGQDAETFAAANKLSILTDTDYRRLARWENTTCVTLQGSDEGAPDRTAWKGDYISTLGSDRALYVYHHGITAITTRLSSSTWRNIALYPSTLRAAAVNNGLGNWMALPVNGLNISFYYEISPQYLGANMTLPKEYSAGYDKNGKKEGWYTITRRMNEYTLTYLPR